MPTSSRFSVATHLLVVIASDPSRAHRSEDLAQRAQTNPAVIRKITAQLAKAGITSSRLGHGGGAILARDANTITLADVFEAVEDSEVFGAPRCMPNENCHVGANILGLLKGTTDRAENALKAELALTTIGDLAAALPKELRKA